MGSPSGWRDDEQLEYEVVRDEAIKTEIPLAMFWSSGLVILLSTVNFLIRPEYFPVFHLMDYAAALLLLGVGLWLRRPGVGRRAVTWGFTACMVALVFELLAQVWTDPLTGPSYVLIVICMFGPLVLAWRPLWLGATLMIGGVAVATSNLPGGQVVDWTFLAASAALASAVLLKLRVRSLQYQARAIAQVSRDATQDPLTGVLNRRGLAQLLPGFAATARRLNQTVVVHFMDVDGLKTANDAWGHSFGDQVLRCVASAVSAGVREGDLVARWGGDEFLVVTMGSEPTDQVFVTRLRDDIRSSGIDLGRWPGVVSVGASSGNLDEASIEVLIAQADQDMYLRRNVRRELATPRGEESGP